MAVGIQGGKIKTRRIADVQRVFNQCKRPAAAAEYNHLRVQLEDGAEVHLMFTDNELQRAMDRAKKNPEDCPKVSVLRDLFD